MSAEKVAVSTAQQTTVLPQTHIAPDVACLRVAVLGAGGLGKGAAKILAKKQTIRLVAMCDSQGAVYDPRGLVLEAVANNRGNLVADYRREAPSSSTLVADITPDPIAAIIEWADELDGIFIALPNMPNEFIPGIVKRVVSAKRGLVFSDVLKRTRAVEHMLALDGLVKDAQSVVLTGCGATPGLLTAAAVLAAQSFIEVERVDVWWGVGIANWDAYKATIREDIAHVPGYSVERAKAMTDDEVDAFLAKTNGLLELHHMEHADDILLERVGVVRSREQVEVGGVMDTRHAKKPVSTTMTLTGITYEGKRASHRFILGDETTMAANVVGPALGYLARGQWLKSRGLYGVFGCTEFLPMVVR